MVIEAKNVDDYLEKVPERRKKALIKLRELCLELLPGYEEDLAYNMPVYKKDFDAEVGFASQKNYISFYCAIHQVMLANAEILKNLNHGKGCIRFSNPDKIDFEIIRKLLTDTANSTQKPC